MRIWKPNSRGNMRIIDKKSTNILSVYVVGKGKNSYIEIYYQPKYCGETQELEFTIEEAEKFIVIFQKTLEKAKENLQKPIEDDDHDDE